MEERIPAAERIERARQTRSPKLELDRCGLYKVPKEVRDFTFVESLNLEFNNLRDLPKWLRKLDALTELNVGANAFYEVPLVIHRLTGLRVLDLSENNLEGEPLDFLGGLTNLTRLYLVDTRSDRLPESIGGLTQMRELNLYRGFFTNSPDSLPPSLGRLTNLTALELSRNGLHEVPEWVRGMTKLRSLGLWMTDITEIPEWLTELTALERLALPCDPGTGLLAAILRLPHLTDLSIDGEEVELGQG
ncbi:hypothetical protein Val02_75250 [Virgisporangium aliadipatigenens]|uniref:Disease resistance R13L4/SHOC-2-like LRR domain-containing protein n=1 Tax=Virgisporangium aliadipatigenens TaxID=741659 RepID=A0A8J3YS13_9ACTN|nr:hypothetical protein [Virgisporangium aliadipatigenens]GIJ50639.1 hypothetical protein Val02_75250 [Virgisporangium aliadipatigenens]